MAPRRAGAASGRGDRAPEQPREPAQGGNLRNETEIEPTDRIVLVCEKCGEKVVLLGGREDWVAEERTSFECGSCGALVLLDLLGDRTVRVWPEDEGAKPAEPWVGGAEGSEEDSVRKLIQKLRAAEAG